MDELMAGLTGLQGLSDDEELSGVDEFTAAEGLIDELAREGVLEPTEHCTLDHAVVRNPGIFLRRCTQEFGARIAHARVQGEESVGNTSGDGTPGEESA